MQSPVVTLRSQVGLHRQNLSDGLLELRAHLSGGRLEVGRVSNESIRESLVKRGFEAFARGHGFHTLFYRMPKWPYRKVGRLSSSRALRNAGP